MQDAVAFLPAQKGGHFDPWLVDLFVQQLPNIDAIRLRWAEKESETVAT